MSIVPSFPFYLSLTMSSVTEAIKSTFGGPKNTAKHADLQRDVVDPSKVKENVLTTDHGVKVSDTDNWCVVQLFRTMLAFLTAPKVEGIEWQ